MIDYIERDYTITAEQQKKQIKKEYEAKGKTVLLISSINNRKIQIMYTEKGA